MRTKQTGKRVISLFLMIFLFSTGAGISRATIPQEPRPKEPFSAWSKLWLEEVVPYIINSLEKELFLQLRTERERGEFIESFWKKRDPNPSTPENEFKLEYYRRIALANRFFGTSGIAGWRTDRGKIYILLGAPKDVQRDFSSSSSDFSLFQGPKETWQYWDLPNPKLPYNLEFVFVDKFGTGNYVLDRSLRVDQGRNETFDINSVTFQFDAMETLSEALKNPFENLEKLKGVVTTKVDFNLIPFHWDVFSFKSSAKKTYLPLLIEIPYSSLPVKKSGEDDFVSLNLSLNVSNTLGQIVFGTSRDVNFRKTAAELTSLADQNLQLQASLILAPAAYTFHLLILDNYSGKIGTSRKEIFVPDFSGEEPVMSDLILSAKPIEEKSPAEVKGAGSQLQEISLAGAFSVFSSGEELNLYLEIYNLSLDQTTGWHKFTAEYSFRQGDKTLARISAAQAPFSAERDCRMQNSFRLKNFKPGDYVLRATITDEISGKSFWKERSFRVSD